MMKNGKSIIVGIGGGSASGKTTFVKRLSGIIGKDNLCILHHDSYYRDRSGISPEARAEINYDHPSALETALLAKHLKKLREGEEIEAPVYDFRTHCRENRAARIEPRPLILVEGILVLSEVSLLEQMDFKIFIELDTDLLLARRISRDISERGRTVEASLRQYAETTRPMLHQFVLPSRQNADLIISGETCFEDKSVAVIGLGLKALLDQHDLRSLEK
jgi:uridine kinase